VQPGRRIYPVSMQVLRRQKENCGRRVTQPAEGRHDFKGLGAPAKVQLATERTDAPVPEPQLKALNNCDRSEGLEHIIEL
jgi:hypothetical protein